MVIPWWTSASKPAPAGNVAQDRDNYDDEVDNAVSAMTSLLEPIMIVFLAVIVGSIVIAMFLPLIELMNRVGDSGGGKKGDE
jgi:type IV pilus assembly protein PilC